MAETLKIIITGDSKDAQKASKDLREDVDKTSSNLLKLGAAAAIAAGAFVVTKSIQAAIKFEAAISDLSAITGATGDDLAFISDKAKEFGRTTTLSASESAEAFKLIASAKPDLLDNAAALAAVTKEAITLAEASGATLPDSARTLGSALNQFNADADESSRFINVLAAGAKLGASEISDTALALKNSGVAAAGAAISFEATNAAIQTLSLVSIKGGEAGTALRNIILRLQTQTEDKFKPSVVGLAQALKNLRIEQLNDIEVTKLFGVETFSAAQHLIKNADSVDDLTGALTGTATAYEQASIKTDNLEGDLKQLDSALEGVAIEMGEELGPELRTLAQDATKFISAMAPVAVVTAQAILVAFKPVTTIFKAVSEGMEAFQAGAEASDSKVRGMMQSVKAFNNVLLPNAELLKGMGINVRDIDARNIDEVTAAMMKLNQHSRENNTELETRHKINNKLIPQEKEKAAIEEKAGGAKKKKADIDKKPDAKAEAAAAKKAEEEQKAIDESITRQEAKNQKLREMAEAFQLTELERENLRAEREEEQFNTDLGLLVERGITVDEAIALQGQGRLDAEAIHQERLRLIDEAARDAKKAMLTGAFSDITGLLLGGNSKLASIGKKFALAQATAALPSAVIQSFQRGGGYPWGLIPAGIMAAKGAVEISKIKKSGQAHAGLDRSSEDQTLLVKRDEMVLDSGTSAGVRRAAIGLAGRRETGRGRGLQITIGDINISLKTTLTGNNLKTWIEDELSPGIIDAVRKGIPFALQPEEAF